MGIDEQTFTFLGIAASLSTALRTGLLQELATGAPATARELAARLGLDERAVGLLLEVLRADDLASRDGDRYGAGEALRFLGQQPGGFALSLGLWAHVEAFVRTGEPFVLMDRSPAERENVYRNVVAGLATLFEAPARELVGKLPLRPRRILDVGCGSGVWSLAIAERDPGAHVVGLDLPAVLEAFSARAAALGLADRISTLPGDMHALELPPGGFDLAIIANVLRLDPPERSAALVRRVARAVAADGALLVVDALATGTPELERARAAYAMHLGLRTREGQVHAPDTIRAWLADAGLPRIQAIEVAGGAGALGALLAFRG